MFSHMSILCRVQLKCDGARWRTAGEVKGKMANGVGSQYSSHYLGTWCMQHYYRWCRTPRLPVVDWTDAPADLNGLVRFAERRNLVSARVPSHFKRSLPKSLMTRWSNSYIYICIYKYIYLCIYTDIYTHIYVCIYINIYIYVCIYTYEYAYIHKHMYVYRNIYMYVYTHISMCVYIYTHLYVCIYKHIYVYILIYVYVYIYIYIYINRKFLNVNVL